MRMCQIHWNAMKKAIDDNGLRPLVSTSGEEAAMRFHKDISTERRDPRNFDPLMDMIMFFTDRVILRVGSEVLHEPNREKCPLCEFDNVATIGELKSMDWIDKTAVSMREFVTEQGLIKTQ